MTPDERKKAAIAIFEWIEELLGKEAASTWLWATTPFPCGLPSDDQLHQGLLVASGELLLNELLASVDAEMEAAMAEYREANP